MLSICWWSVAKSFLTLWDPMDCSMPCFPVLHCFPEFAHLILCHPLLLLPAIFPNITVFSNAAYWIPKCVSFLKIFFFFLMLSPFLDFLLNLLQYYFCFMFWYFGPKACGILASQLEIKPTPPALEGKILTTGPPGTFPRLIHLITRSLYLLTNISTVSLLPSPWQYHSTVSLSLAFLDSTCKWYHTVFVFLSGLSHLA